MPSKKQLKRHIRQIEKVLKRAESGEYAVKGRDFGRGVAFLAAELRRVSKLRQDANEADA